MSRFEVKGLRLFDSCVKGFQRNTQVGVIWHGTAYSEGYLDMFSHNSITWDAGFRQGNIGQSPLGTDRYCNERDSLLTHLLGCDERQGVCIMGTIRNKDDSPYIIGGLKDVLQWPGKIRSVRKVIHGIGLTGEFDGEKLCSIRQLSLESAGDDMLCPFLPGNDFSSSLGNVSGLHGGRGIPQDGNDGVRGRRRLFYQFRLEQQDGHRCDDEESQCFQ